jgi:hypothetical protein
MKLTAWECEDEATENTFSVHLAFGFTIFRSEFMPPSIKPACTASIARLLQFISDVHIRALATHGVIFARNAARVARHRRRRRGWFHPSRASCPIPRRAEHISGARIRVSRVGGALRMIIENPRDARTCFPPLPSRVI